MNQADIRTSSQVIDIVCENFSQLPRKITRDIIQDFLEILEKELINGGRIKVERLGILEVKDCKARKGRNPKTGVEVDIPATKKVNFRASKSLKEKVASLK